MPIDRCIYDKCIYHLLIVLKNSVDARQNMQKDDPLYTIFIDELRTLIYVFRLHYYYFDVIWTNFVTLYGFLIH